MSNTIYGLHTYEAKKQITCREAKNIELLFGTSFSDEHLACSHFFKEGVSKFWIEEVVNKTGKKYFLHLKVNMARACDIGEYCLMPYTIPNVKKVVRRISKVLKQLKLQGNNADFGEWKLERFDSAFDIEVTLPELFMSLLDKSVDVNANKRQCKRLTFIPVNTNVCESMRFGNNSYIYNIYIKLAELKNHGVVITTEILKEVTNIVRIERQNQLSAIKSLLPNGLVKDLALASVRDVILKAMITDIEAFWGKGNYYSAKEICTEFSDMTDVKKLIPVMAKFTNSSLEDEYSLYTPEIKQQFQNYGIMPVGICKEDVKKFQVYKMNGLYTIVTDTYAVPDKRAYHVFPVPHLCNDGRYKAGITFHMVNDTRPQPVSIAKKTIEEYEQEVFKELKRVYVTNIKYHCTVRKIPELIKKSVNDILRFYQVVESKNVKDLVREYIKKMKLKNNN